MSATSCAEAVKLLWEYLDDLLDEHDQEMVTEHLETCRRCCGEVEFLYELRRVLAAAGRAEDAPLPADVLRRFDETLEGLGQ
jgi:anti-sigma factor (TIGR02949 family)